MGTVTLWLPRGAVNAPLHSLLPMPAPAGFTATDALLALCVVFWGVNFIVVKAALGVMHPFAFNAARFVLASGTLLAVAAARHARLPPRDTWMRLFVLGVLGNFIYQFCFIMGVNSTRAGNAALIMAAVPVQTAVLSHMRGTERLRGRDILGLAFGVGGIATIVFGSGKEVGFGSTVTGDLLMFGATICWTLYTLGSKPLADRLGPTVTTAWTVMAGTIPLTLIAIPAVFRQDWSRVGAPAWGAVLYSGLLSLTAAYLIWYRGVARLGPSRTSMYSNFTPVVAVLAAWLLLGETPTLWQGLGAGGIFTGIWLTRT
jgi:drug/metabolite transporter (DMT)-like permease